MIKKNKLNNNKDLDKVLSLLNTILNKDEFSLAFSDEIMQITLKKPKILSVLKLLKENESFKFNQLIDITAVDYPNKKNRFEMIYIFLSVEKNLRLIVKFLLEEDEEVDSLTQLFPSANWYEREVWDLFGIAFNNHPDLRRLLTDYGFIGHPLRKDFPLSGNVEVKYDVSSKKVVYEPVKLTQSFREFDFESPWEGEEIEKNND